MVTAKNASRFLSRPSWVLRVGSRFARVAPLIDEVRWFAPLGGAAKSASRFLPRPSLALRAGLASLGSSAVRQDVLACASWWSGKKRFALFAAGFFGRSAPA